MRKYEHKVVDRHSLPLSLLLNIYGEAGWMLCGVDKDVLIFVRESQPEAETQYGYGMGKEFNVIPFPERRAVPERKVMEVG